MKIPHDQFCVLPWISLETSPVGSVRPCCLAEEEIVDNDGNKFNLATDSDLKAVQDSQYMTNLRSDFLAGKKPATCRKCWNEERAGRTSKRMHTLDRLKHMVTDTDWTEDAKPLMFLDLKLGNICNLKCRICGSWSSSTFASEEVQHINIEFEDKKKSYAYQMLKQGAWPQDNQHFWKDIDSVLNQIRYIEFTGGEPFMIQQHFDLLQKIVDNGTAGQVEIHYNTNGTHYPENAEEIWKNFKTVEIAFSIDDVKERFEYQRSNAVWSEVLENISKFLAMRKRLSNIQLQACITVNVFNVMYLEDIANWAEQQKFNFVYWNMLHEAFYFSIGTMPADVKQKVEQRLRAAQVSQKSQQEFNKIIDFMNNGVELDGFMLKLKVRDLDCKRNQDLRDHHPELADAIGYNGPMD
jgi:MoaA/NifB/PqqE/SkfB family radical SAM enzyme